MSFLEQFDRQGSAPSFVIEDDAAWSPPLRNDEEDVTSAWGDVDIDLDALIQRSTSQPNYVLTDVEIDRIVGMAVSFCSIATNVKLYPYQESFQRRIIESIIREDSEEVTALFSRQSGKTETVAVTVTPLLAFLPLLANTAPFNADSRINKFKDGFWVGVFGPTNEIVDIMGARMASRMASEAMREALAEPEIGLEYEARRKSIRLDNGSFIDCVSASPQAKIEGKTYHLIITEESQDISDTKLRKSIHPMGAATGATLVKIGTPSITRNDFYGACMRGVRRRLTHPKESPNHFQFDYTTVLQYNYRYAKYIKKEIERLGYDSDDFKMSYRLEWLIDRGHFLEDGLLESCGIKHKEVLRVRVQGRDEAFTLYDTVMTTTSHESDLVAALDIGKSQDSTVLTIGKVFWKNPLEVDGQRRYHIHILKWLEIAGDDHEAQYNRLIEELNQHNLRALIVDRTGKGDPIFDRLVAKVKRHGSDREQVKLHRKLSVHGFTFSDKSKDAGYTLLKQEMVARRLTYPNGDTAQKRNTQRKFKLQLHDLTKSHNGKYMKVEAPKLSTNSREKAHDDYPDSLMMLVWLVNKGQGTEVRGVKGNPFYGDSSGIMSYANTVKSIQSIKGR